MNDSRIRLGKLILIGGGASIALAGLLAACGCDDMGCLPTTVRLDPSYVSTGGTFDIQVIEDPLISCASEGVHCVQDLFRVDLMAPHRPKAIIMVVMDAAGNEVARYEAKPKYGVTQAGVCGDCPGAEALMVP